MNLIQQCLYKSVKVIITTLYIFSVELQVKVLAVPQWVPEGPLDAANMGLWSLGGG